MTNAVTIAKCFDVPHLKVTSIQHVLGWLKEGVHMGGVLKNGENITDKDGAGH